MNHRRIPGWAAITASLLLVSSVVGCSSSSSPEAVVKKHIEAARAGNKDGFLDTLAKQKRSQIVDMVHHQMRGDYVAMMQDHAKRYEGAYAIESTIVSGDNANVTVSFMIVTVNGGRQRRLIFECVREHGWKIGRIELTANVGGPSRGPISATVDGPKTQVENAIGQTGASQGDPPRVSIPDTTKMSLRERVRAVAKAYVDAWVARDYLTMWKLTPIEARGSGSYEEWRDAFVASARENQVAIDRRIGEPELNDSDPLAFLRRPYAEIRVEGTWRGKSGQFTLHLSRFVAEDDGLKVGRFAALASTMPR